MERTPASEELGALVGTTLGGRFLVRRLLGRGGMGAVYEVEHVVTKRSGALKLLHPTRAAMPSVVERFVREASAAARIGSPHIVETLDAGELPSGEPYIFMELLVGSPVSHLIRAEGRLGLAVACDIVAQAAVGLGAAHERGIVHRDVKPDNLFVCAGPTPRVKIVDFGVSKFGPLVLDEERLTLDGTPMGTPHYMSPEQVTGQSDIDFRTDIYSLGVVLYECLTGRVPFTAETLAALGVRIFAASYVSASELAPGLPAAVDTIIARAMAPEPSQRFSDMGALRAALLDLSPAPARSDLPALISIAKVEPARETATEPGLSAEPAVTPPLRHGSSLPAAEPLGSQVTAPRAWFFRRRALLSGGLAVAATAAGLLWRRDAETPPRGAPAAATERDTSFSTAAPPDASSAHVLGAPSPSALASGTEPGAARAPQATAKTPIATQREAQARPAPSGAKPRRTDGAQSRPLPSSLVARDGLGTENPFR